MKHSKTIIGMLKEFEGYVSVARQLKGDRKGVITGGHGTIIHPSGAPVKAGDVFSKEYAEYCLIFELNTKCKQLDRILTKYNLVLNQNQFDALASFAYNLGCGWFNRGFKIGDAMYSHDFQSISESFLLYNKGTEYFLGIPRKVVIKGLDDRRKAEKSLFDKEFVYTEV